MLHVFDVDEKNVISFESTSKQTERNRFEGILNTVSSSAKEEEMRGNNNVSFPLSFLSDTSSHVLPSSSIMLTSLLNELLRKRDETEEEEEKHEKKEAIPSEIASLLMEDDNMTTTEKKREEEEKLPHHFGTDARMKLVNVFK